MRRLLCLRRRIPSPNSQAQRKVRCVRLLGLRRRTPSRLRRQANAKSLGPTNSLLRQQQRADLQEEGVLRHELRLAILQGGGNGQACDLNHSRGRKHQHRGR